jgi:hypothetical protein
LEENEVIDGYIRESTPLCYVWPKDRPQIPASDAKINASTLLPPLTEIIDKLLPKAPPTTIAPAVKEQPKASNSAEENTLIDSEELCSGVEKKAFDSAMKKLKEVYNGQKGAKSDHWYTTEKKTSGYKTTVRSKGTVKFIGF